ncbi:MAG: hypothetical protein LBF71_00565 [Campylobacteraceae bacterium]|jgi:hypothetical protein|nr:hypothetical protein [Campylobacteraceae bacterium]
MFGNIMDFFNKNSQGIGAIGNLLGSVGQAYDSYKTAKYNKKLMDMNKQYFQWSLDKQKKNDESFNKGFNLNLV